MVKRGNRPGTRWAFMERFDIPDTYTNRLYIRRWRIIQTPLFGVFLHKIMLPDADRDLHDHPWNFRSIILLGGYGEIRWRDHRVQQKYWKRWSVHKVVTTDRHRITNLFRVPTWTLILVGRRSRDWGFWVVTDDKTTTRWVPWREYSATRGANVS